MQFRGVTFSWFCFHLVPRFCRVPFIEEDTPCVRAMVRKAPLSLIASSRGQENDAEGGTLDNGVPPDKTRWEDSESVKAEGPAL